MHLPGAGFKPDLHALPTRRSSDLLRLKSTNAATPFTAATVVVPLSVLPPALEPSATVTLPVKLGTGFPAGSSAVTWTAGLVGAPATVFSGRLGKASCVAVPGRMSN